jgi:glucokinase
MACLLADMGGTNTRCGVTGADGERERIRCFANADFDGPESLLEQYLAGVGSVQRPLRGAIAVAAPIRGEHVEMINIDWSWSTEALASQLGLSDLGVLNDFEALAYSLPELGEHQLLKLGGGVALPDKPKAVLGPGTGLGVAGLFPGAHGWEAISGEGGHVTLAAYDEREDRLINAARAHFGHCSAERLISGAGLSFLHRTLHDAAELPPAEIGKLAAAGDPRATESLEVFFLLLGTVAANLALTLGTFGGIYIGGGIVPKHRQAFAASGFRMRFEDKGRYRNYLGAIATLLIVADHPTLTGLAAYARRSGH